MLAALTALAVTAGVIAVGQRNVAIQQRNQAIYENVLTQALQVAASNPSLAAQFLLIAYRLHPNENVASRLINTENTPLANPITGTDTVSVTFA